MRTLRIALMALIGAAASTGALGASAPPPSVLETQAMSIAAACFNAQNETPETATAAVAACEKLLVDIEALKQANASVSGHDLNVFLVVSSMAEMRVAGSYGRIDKVRSARVCERTERGWRSISQLNKALSPSYAGLMDQLVASAVNAVGICRRENGTPAGAVALPAG